MAGLLATASLFLTAAGINFNRKEKNGCRKKVKRRSNDVKLFCITIKPLGNEVKRFDKQSKPFGGQNNRPVRQSK